MQTLAFWYLLCVYAMFSIFSAACFCFPCHSRLTSSHEEVTSYIVRTIYTVLSLNHTNQLYLANQVANSYVTLQIYFQEITFTYLGVTNFSTLKPTVGAMSIFRDSDGFSWLMIVVLPLLSKPTHSTLTSFFFALSQPKRRFIKPIMETVR